MKISCSVEILTLNSGKTLRRCLESLKDFDDIMVIDGNSTDDTASIAKEYGARIFPQSDAPAYNIKIEDFSAVRNIGVREARHKWFLYIDSDEYISAEAVREIRDIVSAGDANRHFVYKIPRKCIVGGEVIERSSVYPNYQMRFFYLPATDGFIKKLHERISVKKGYEAGVLRNPEYVPFDEIAVLKKKWRNYARTQYRGVRVSVGSFLLSAVNDLVQFFKYLVKYALTFVSGSGKRMPFAYEWYNAYYHIWLIQEAFGAFRHNRNDK